MKAVQLESYLISLLFSCSFFIRYVVTYYPLIQFQALLREGHANPNAVGNSGCTPLHIAAHLDHANSVAICKLLVSVHLFCVHFVLLLSVQCCTEGFFGKFDIRSCMKITYFLLIYIEFFYCLLVCASLLCKILIYIFFYY